MHHPPGSDVFRARVAKMPLDKLSVGSGSKCEILFLLQSPSANPWKDPALDKLSLFCEESRSVYDWVPTITLPER